MLPAVVFDVPADLAPAAAGVAVSRCGKVLGDGRCRQLDLGRDPGSVGYYAVVRVSEGERLQIEFRAVAVDGALLARRELSFASGDSEESRWASVGLVVAGLVADADARQQTRSRAVLALPATAAPKRHTVAAPAAYAWGLDLGLVRAAGLTEGVDTWGAVLRPWLGIPSVPVIALSSLRFAQGPDRPRLRWLSMSGGMGSRLGSPSDFVNAELVGEVVLERLIVEAQDPDSGRTGTAGATRFGGRLGINLALRASASFRLLLGVDIATLTPPVKIEVRNEVVGREPLVRAGATVGVRFGR